MDPRKEKVNPYLFAHILLETSGRTWKFISQLTAMFLLLNSTRIDYYTYFFFILEFHRFSSTTKLYKFSMCLNKHYYFVNLTLWNDHHCRCIVVPYFSNLALEKLLRYTSIKSCKSFLNLTLWNDDSCSCIVVTYFLT